MRQADVVSDAPGPGDSPLSSRIIPLHECVHVARGMAMNMNSCSRAAAAPGLAHDWWKGQSQRKKEHSMTRGHRHSREGKSCAKSRGDAIGATPRAGGATHSWQS